MTTLVIITWLLNIGALVGVVLNIRHRRECFYVWFVTNAGWCLVDLYYGIYAQAVLFFVYWLLAIWGIFAWRTKKMKPFTVSKNLSSGTICAFKGNKLIRASNRTKRIAGIWTIGTRTIIHSPDGVTHDEISPTGLQTFGPAKLKVFVRT